MSVAPRGSILKSVVRLGHPLVELSLVFAHRRDGERADAPIPTISRQTWAP